MLAQCIDCSTPMYPWEDHNGGIEYTCPKCGYEDLPKFIMERFPEFRTKNICIHFNWNDNCKACKMDNIRENTQALIRKDLLLDDKTLEDVQFETKQAMLKFNNKS